MVEPHGGSAHPHLSFFSFSTVDGRTSMIFFFVFEATTAPLMATCIYYFLHLLGCPSAGTRLRWDDEFRWVGLDINFFSCFWQIPKEKRDNAPQIIHGVSRQGNKLERGDLERLVGLFGVGCRFHASLETLSNIVVAFINSVRRSDQPNIQHLSAHLKRRTQRIVPRLAHYHRCSQRCGISTRGS